jgi:hypothetical protein
MLKYPNFNKALKDYGDAIVNEARKNLAGRLPKEEVKAEWDKVGNRWVAKKIRKRSVKKKTNTSGKLSRSIKYDVKSDNTKVTISMLGYGETVDQGRKPGGRGVPERTLKIWIKKKGKDEDLYFQINRKIKKFGIKPTDFFKKAFDAESKNVATKIYSGLEQDFDDFFDSIFKNN